MRVLIIGAGTMGARHLQAMAHLPAPSTIMVLETRTEARSKALELWQKMPNHGRHDLHFIGTADLPETAADAAILSTPAGGRLGLLRSVVEAGIRNILVEKVLFQSVPDYRAARALAEEPGLDVRAHVPLRAIDQISRLRATHGGRLVRMNVCIGNRGMGCNGIHYIDLFRFIADSEITGLDAVIDWPLDSNRRDPALIEFSGRITAVTGSGSTLDVAFERNSEHLPVITVEADTHRTTLRFDATRAESTLAELNGTEIRMPMASDLTHTLVLEMLEKRSILPTLAEGETSNVLMLQAYNRTLGYDADAVCPIT